MVTPTIGSFQLSIQTLFFCSSLKNIQFPSRPFSSRKLSSTTYFSFGSYYALRTTYTSNKKVITSLTAHSPTIFRNSTFKTKMNMRREKPKLVYFHARCVSTQLTQAATVHPIVRRPLYNLHDSVNVAITLSSGISKTQGAAVSL